MKIRSWLLSSVAMFNRPDDGGSGGGPDEGEDRIPEPSLDDDETVTDPIDEDDAGNQDDDGQDDDDQDDDEGDGGEGDEPPQQGRGNRQFGELRRTARETARQNAELTRQLAEMRGELTAIRQSRETAPQETPQQREERLALMSPDDRTAYIVNEALQRNQQQQAQLTAQLLDQGDKASFDAQASANPLLKKLSPQIEREIQAMRSQGRPVPPRNVIASYLIGQKVLEQQGKGKGDRRQNRQRHQARPVRSGSDGNTQPRARRGAPQTAEDYEAQFGDVQI